MVDRPPQPDDELLLDALELPPEEREAFLRRACGEDQSRLQDLRSLLSAHERAGTFLDDAPALESTDSWLHERVGVYQLEKLLGSGGSGRVYEAHRATGDFEQRVAIKLIQRSLDVEGDARRFRVECEALARLDHPNIAHLIDGGLADGKQPYVAMELVEGTALNTHCDTNRLSVVQRLRLFQDVCSAVDYAHQNLVIHRDLKPSNILVNREGRVKLLDFGIAKLLSPDGHEAAADATLANQVRLTPRYASPEQLGGRSITTLSDVYSLGIVLYELVTGKAPYELQGRTSEEWERSVRSTTITRPSQAVDDTTSRARGEALYALRKRIRGDLDNVLLKALHRDPTRRYHSPAALAADIQRYFDELPVQARPDTAGYRLSKFVGRNAAAVAAGSLVALALVVATVVSTIAFFNVRAAQRESEVQRLTAERTVEFLQSMIASVDPDESQTQDEVTVLQLLDGSEKRIDEELAQEPLVAATLHSTLGTAYQHLRSMDKAEHSLRRALELYETQLGPEAARSIDARTKFAGFLADKADLEAAQQEVTRALEYAEGAPSRDRLGALALLSDILARRGDFEGAIERGKEAIAIARDEAKDEALLEALNHVGLAYSRAGKPNEAIAMFREAVDLSRVVRGDRHSNTGQVLNNLGFTLKMAGREAEAVPFIREALGIYESVFEPHHTRVAAARSNLGDVLGKAGAFEEAEKYHHAAIESFRTTLGPDHPNTGHATNSLGMLFMMKRDYREGIGAFAEAARIYRKGFGNEHPYVAAALHNMARSQRRSGDLAAAMQTGQEVWKIRSAVLPADNPDIARSSEFMGRMMMDLDRPKEAKPWFERSVEIRRNVYQADNLMRIDAERELGLCLQALGEFEEAERRLQTALDALVEHYGNQHERTVACKAQLQALHKQMAVPVANHLEP